MFSIGMWNVNLLVSNNLPRTNDNIEAYHNAFKSSLSCLHPNTWKFIGTLKKEESLALTRKMQVENGEATQRKKKYKEANARLQNIVRNYNSKDKLSFLKYISHDVK